jgi:hypothetical protein
MVALDGSATWAVVEIAAIMLAPTVVLYAALNAARVLRWAGRRWRRLRPVAAAPSGPPLERIVADLHRIVGVIEALPPLAPLARRQGAILAYDDALGSACRALGVDDELRGLPFGPRRDAARIRVEASLACAGLDLAPRRAA